MAVITCAHHDCCKIVNKLPITNTGNADELVGKFHYNINGINVGTQYHGM